MNFLTHKLSEPNGSTITNAEIPISPYRNSRIIRNAAKLSFLTQAVHLATVVASFLSAIEVTVKLLLNHVFWHAFSALGLNLFFSKNARLRNSKHLKKPLVRVSPSDFRKFPPVILATWRVNKCAPTAISSQDWLNKVVGHRVHQRPFAKYHPFRIRSHNRIVTIRTYKLYQRLTLATIDPNLHLCVIWIPVNNLLRDVI